VSFFTRGKSNDGKKLCGKKSYNAIVSIKSTCSKHPEMVEQYGNFSKASQANKNNTVLPFLRA
jgi:hypothetical protein